MKPAAIALVTLLSGTIVSAQPQPAPPNPPAQQAARQLKNVQVLKDMSPAEVVRAMQFMSASLGVGCEFCHVFKPGGERDFASDDKEEKRTGREMIKLVMDTNAKYFNNHTVVSCTTCHRGSPHPVSVPVLPLAASAHTDDHVREAAAAAEPRPVTPTRDELVARYAKALGNIDPMVKSIELKGTRDVERGGSVPINVVMANGNTRISSTTPEGEMVNVVTTTGGWARDPRGTRAMPPMQLEGTRQMLDALRLPLPSEIPAEGRVGKDRVKDHEVWVLTSPVGSTGRQRLYFDAGTGLLVRRLTLVSMPVGNVPQQTDFDDYRDVGGFKLPFLVELASVDRNMSRTIHYTEITPNAKIDEKVFVQPQ